MMASDDKENDGHGANEHRQAWVELSVSQGGCKINNDANGGEKKKCDAAKEYCEGQKESPTFLPVRGREVMRAGKSECRVGA